MKALETRDFRRDKSVSTSDSGYHYNHNAENCVEAGNAPGCGMAELFKGKRSESAAAGAPNRDG